MPETALILPDNLSHNVSAQLETAKNTVSGLATVPGPVLLARRGPVSFV